MTQLAACATDDQEVAGLTPLGQQNSFVEIDYKIHVLSTVILSERAVVSFWQKNVHNTG